MSVLPRVNKLIADPVYQNYLHKIAEAEKDRLYCKHGPDHGLAVARIAYAYLLEQGGPVPAKEVIYAAALLHDIGRWAEYASGEDHALAGAALARPLLEKSGFDSREIKLIEQAIAEHSTHRSENLSDLGRALALADDWARDCLQCKVKDSCHKFTEQMNQIVY
ncbi:MAG TPA: HD domain-containing protein [Desulfitobacteriaceae bacterium]|nr:HD domain-containing protein [Desulfitobacteriaceae bacterium]